jgi:Protein kinase domain
MTLDLNRAAEMEARHATDPIWRWFMRCTNALWGAAGRIASFFPSAIKRLRVKNPFVGLALLTLIFIGGFIVVAPMYLFIAPVLQVLLVIAAAIRVIFSALTARWFGHSTSAVELPPACPQSRAESKEGDQNHRLPEGFVIADRYRVLNKLGEGGMGSVWRGADITLDGRPVAIKLLPSALAFDKRAIRQLKQEAKIAMRLSHPHVVTLRAFEQCYGGSFLIMDFIDGLSLAQFLNSTGTLSPDRMRHLFIPIAEALDYAHSESVIHRDLKPSNILISKEGKPHLADFGVARELEENLMRVTGKKISGTVPYMSPEQLLGKPPSVAQDIYGLAATMYECVTGHPPFYRGEIEYQILHEPPLPLPGNVPLFRLIMAGLSKVPEQRPRSCIELVSERNISNN